MCVCVCERERERDLHLVGNFVLMYKLDRDAQLSLLLLSILLQLPLTKPHFLFDAIVFFIPTFSGRRQNVSFVSVCVCVCVYVCVWQVYFGMTNRDSKALPQSNKSSKYFSVSKIFGKRPKEEEERERRREGDEGREAAN